MMVRTHSHHDRATLLYQMSNTIQHVGYSDDFEADVLLFSGQFLQQFNPEMVWASKGFVLF